MDDKTKVGVGVTVIATLILGLVIGNYVIPNEQTINMPNFPMGSPPMEGDAYTLRLGWNLVSMPGTVNKTSICFVYNTTVYTWQQAISNLIIYDNVYGYNGTAYFRISEFLESKGYWLYSLKEGVIMTMQTDILFCKKIMFDGTSNLTCTALVISNAYTNTIHCHSMTAERVTFTYDDVGVMKEE